jgi:hypothetical protein
MAMIISQNMNQLHQRGASMRQKDFGAGFVSAELVAFIDGIINALRAVSFTGI